MHEQDRDQHVRGEDESDGARENAEDQREPTEQFYGDDDPGGERGAGTPRLPRNPAVLPSPNWNSV